MKIEKCYIIVAIIISMLLNGIAGNSVADSILQKISQEFTEIVRQVNPSVVEIIAISEIKIPQKSQGENIHIHYHQKNIGSGIIIDKQGHIITTVSVVRNANNIRVSLIDGRKLDAILVGSDEETDIAVLQIKSNSLPVASLGDSDDVMPGSLAVTVGRSYGDIPTYALGIVSGVETLPNGPICDMIKLNIRVNPGNSGGAVVDTSGKLIGVISATLAEPQIALSPRYFNRTGPNQSKHGPEALEVSDSYAPNLPPASTSGNIFTRQGTSFAIPINTANKIAKELIAHGEIQRGWLGVWIKQQNSQTGMPTGVVVIQLAKGSPALQAGIRINDTITAFNDKEVRTVYDLKRFVAESLPGTKITLKIIRTGKELSVKVTLGRSIKDRSK